MAENPLKSLLPKDTQGPGMGKELQEKFRMQNEAKSSLQRPVSEPEKPTGAPSPMSPVKGPYGSQPGEKRIDTSYPGTPMPKFHKGGTVKETGPAMLKKGEKVLTPEQHGQLKTAMSLASSALSHESEKDAEPAKEIRAMHIRKASDGSHVIEHHHVHFSHPMEEHTAKNMDELHDHLEQHWGGPNDGENESESEKDESPGVAAAEKAIGLEK